MGVIAKGLGGVLVALIVCLSAWGQSTGTSPIDDKRLQGMLTDGIALMRAGQAAQALANYFEPVIQEYEQRYRDGKTRVYSARSPTETLLYALEAAKAEPRQNASVYSGNWGLAYFLKGYALVELKRPAEAVVAIDSAIALSPQNAQYLNERGQLYIVAKNWSEAQKTFAAAEKAAREFSPPEVMKAELGRALRGQAYVRIELNQLDEAEKLYTQCLELNKDDRMAQGQLRYIAGLRTRRSDAATAPPDAASSGFSAAWGMAEAQFSVPAVMDYVRTFSLGGIWNDQGIQKYARMPDDKAVLECLTAIMPGPEKARMVFVVDEKGLVTAAHTDQKGWVAECMANKLVGHRMPPPPVAPMYFCSRYEKTGENTTQLSHCGAVSLVRSCGRNGISSTCQVYARQ